MHTLLLATRNAHKTREFAAILGDKFEVRDLRSGPASPVVEETGRTFVENAILKAVAVSKYFSEMVVADDSGLEVDLLGGAPGVFSARYAGEGASDEENLEKLLREITAVDPLSLPTARFRCALALARKGEVLGTFEAAAEGSIVPAPRGVAGFGYDPVFAPAGSARTFAEMSPVEKSHISHRAVAIRSLRAAWFGDADARGN